MTASALVLVPLGLYMLVLIGLGLWGRREGGSLEGYYVAGKKLPSWVIAFSSNATGESGWLLLGLTGMGYAVGFHALWVVFGEVMGVAIAWTLVSRPFKEYTDRYRAITVPDYLEQRFRDRRQLLRKLSIAIILSMVAVYCCAQLVATGKAFSSFLGFSYVTGVLLGAGVTIVYTAVGGLQGGRLLGPGAGPAHGGWARHAPDRRHRGRGRLERSDRRARDGRSQPAARDGQPRRDLGRRAFGRELRRHRARLSGGAATPDPVHVRGFGPRTRARRPGRGRVHGAVRHRRGVHRDRRPGPVSVAGRSGNRDADDERGAVPGPLHRHLPGHRSGRDHVDRRFPP